MAYDFLDDYKLLTVSEVATIMRVSKMTVYRLCNSGELQSNRIGKSVRIREKYVYDYLHRNDK